MKDATPFLPQRPPLVLLSGFEESPELDEVTSFVDVSDSSPFFEREINAVPACVALEYMAQTMALLVGRKRRAQNLPPQIGFVLGSRRLTVSIPGFAVHTRYAVKARCVYADESFGSFDCEILAPDGVRVASATVTAYQPEGEMTQERLEAYG